MTTGEKIKYFRNMRGISQDTLGQLSGINSATIKKYEYGIRNPKPDQLLKIANALGISINIFMDFDIETVSDVLSLLFKLDDQIDMKFEADKDEEGNFKPATVKLSFKNNLINKKLCTYMKALEIRENMINAKDEYSEAEYADNLQHINENIEEIKQHLLDDSIFADLIKVEHGKNEQRSRFLVDAVKQMRQENDVSSKALQDKLEVMNNSPQKKLVTHRFEPTSKYVLLFIGGLALSLVLSIWGNLTQWREHKDWEEADLKYRALKMVLPVDDPNIRYIEKHFNVQRDEDIIDKLRTQVDVYEDSVYHYHKMVEIASYKDSIARQLIDESNRIKMQINSKKSK